MDVNVRQARRAKKIAKVLIQETRKEQYSLIKSYVAELNATNPNTIDELCTMRIDNDKNVFH